MSAVMRHKLREREERGDRIKVGIIGAGLFGCLAIEHFMHLLDRAVDPRHIPL